MKITSLTVGTEEATDGRDIIVCRVTVDGQVMESATSLSLTADGGKWSAPDAVATTLQQFADAIRRMGQKAAA